MNTKSEWNYPPPREGFAGQWDRFVGPGATKAEQLIPVFAALAAAALVLGIAATKDLGWTTLQFVLAGFLAFDLFGGPAMLATSSAKRWYHRASSTRAGHLKFVSAHILQIGLVAYFFRNGDWLWLATISTTVFVASSLVLSTSLRFQRTVAFILACIGIALDMSLFDPTPGLPWFVPVLFIKLVIAHSTVEEPYTNLEELKA
ncbi:MAG: hypothetical protein AAF585_10775 [Verrucomicrobiota bacterium]